MQELTLGILSDFHTELTSTKTLIEQIMLHNPDAIILNGDLGDPKQGKKIKQIFKIVSRFKGLIFVQPGSHEDQKSYYEALKSYPKFIDCTKQQKHTIKGYDLIFLPGSDIGITGAEFKILSRPLKNLKKELKFFFLQDLKKLITDPEKTILIAHIPPRCITPNGIDFAFFGKVKQAFIGLNEKNMPIIQSEKGSIFPLSYGLHLKMQGFPIKIVQQNVGNIGLAKLLEEKKITKFICGHIHESGQKAIDTKENLVKEKTWSKELWYNVGAASEGYAGIVKLNKDLMQYKNINGEEV